MTVLWLLAIASWRLRKTFSVAQPGEMRLRVPGVDRITRR